MAGRPRAGRFALQVRLVLVLLVLFLVVLDLMNVFLLVRARDALARAEQAAAEGRAERLLAEGGRDDLVGALRGEGRVPGPLAEWLRRRAARFGFERLALLDGVGREMAAGGLPPPPEAQRLREAAVARPTALASGRSVSPPMVPARGGEDAVMAVYLPLLDPEGKLLGSLEAVRAVPDLGSLESRFRLALAAQVVGLLLIAALALLFANWVSRPYRRLAAAAGEAGLTAPESGPVAEPDELAAAFRAVVTKLRRQDEALGNLEREAGGLADLARFAQTGAASMATGVLVIDRQLRVAGINASAATLLGVGAEETRGMALDAATARIPALGPLARLSVEQGRSATREVLEVEARGGAGPGHVGVALSPVPDPYGAVAGALVLMTDLTEIRELQEQARLRESLAAVGQLSAGIAHEFRNALGTILGWARMLEKREDPRVSGPAREIVKEVDTVRAAVDEFLLYARPPEPARVPVDLGGLVRSSAAAAPEGIDVEVRGEFGMILGDEGLLRRAFGNLLQNAADAGTEAGRKLSVAVTGRVLAGGAVAQVEIEDDGPGIPADRRSQVFVPFFTTRARGTGLGLALVQRTVVDHGGTVEAGAGPRGGALFRIRLPLARP